jgi:hypothetical protein
MIWSAGVVSHFMKCETRGSPRFKRDERRPNRLELPQSERVDFTRRLAKPIGGRGRAEPPEEQRRRRSEDIGVFNPRSFGGTQILASGAERLGATCIRSAIHTADTEVGPPEDAYRFAVELF